MIRFPSPPVRGRMPSHGRMYALAAQSDSERWSTEPEVAGSNPVRGTSGPSPSGRASRPQREGRGFEPRRLHDMRHAAACKRRHSEERRHVKTARPPPSRAQTAASRRPRARRRGRPARPRAGPISRGSWDRIPSPATRMWCSGSTPASQAGDRGFEPRHPLYPENQDNGSDPTMGLVTVLSMWTLPEKTWTNSLGMGTQRQGIRKHAIAPVAQRKSRCLLSTGSGYRNSVGARCLVHRHA